MERLYTKVIEVFEQIDRQNFVPPEYKELAYADCELDIEIILKNEFP